MSKQLLSRVESYMTKFAPLKLVAGSWDNVGVLVEAPCTKPTANKVFLTIDLTTETLDEAIKEENVGVIVAYHPAIFEGYRQLTTRNHKQGLVLTAIANGISIYSPHTTLDSCRFGINDWICDMLEDKCTDTGNSNSNRKFGVREPIEPADLQGLENQEGAGMGRILTLATPIAIDELIQRVKKNFELKHLRVCRAPIHDSKLGGGAKKIQKIAICAGSGSSVLVNAGVGNAGKEGAEEVPVDCYFTGEMSHHEVLLAKSKNISVILTEHSNSERGYLKVLQGYMQKELTDVDVVVSKTDKDPLQVE